MLKSERGPELEEKEEKQHRRKKSPDENLSDRPAKRKKVETGGSGRRERKEPVSHTGEQTDCFADGVS